MTRSFSLSAVAILALVTASACSSSDPPDPTATGGATSTNNKGGSDAGGATSTETSTSATKGGATQSDTKTGTTPDNQGGTGGVTDTGTNAATGGSTEFQPQCGTAANGTAITKNVACDPADPVQKCYKTCGVQSKGWKSETCILDATGAYSYQEDKTTGCMYSVSGNYSCYKIPSTIDLAACGLTTATQLASGTVCDAPACTTCQLNGGYTDGSGNSKPGGYCTCPEAVIGSDGVALPRKWSCASVTEWPCLKTPLLPGC